jgi:hypothetical protein
MTLSPPVRSAVLEVVRLLRDPERHLHTDSIGWMIVDELGIDAYRDTARSPLEQVRAALGLSPILPGSLARWARGKSREEVAQALENVATPAPAER